MTERRYTKAIIGQLAVLAMLILANLISAGAQNRGRAEFSSSLSDFISPDMNYQRILIQRPGAEPVSLILDGERWLVETQGAIAIARNSRVRDFIRAIFSLDFTRRVAGLEGNEAGFGLDTGERISFFDPGGREITSLIFGSVASQLSEQYFSFSGHNEIFAIPTDIGFYLSQSPVYWQELRVWNAESILPDDVIMMSREYADGFAESWQPDSRGSWVDDTGTENETDMRAVVRGFLRLEGLAILGGDLPSEARPQFTITLTVTDGRNLSAAFYRSFGEEGERYFLRPLSGPDFRSAAGMSRLYEIPEWRFLPYLDI